MTALALDRRTERLAQRRGAKSITRSSRAVNPVHGLAGVHGRCIWGRNQSDGAVSRAEGGSVVRGPRGAAQVPSRGALMFANMHVCYVSRSHCKIFLLRSVRE